MHIVSQDYIWRHKYLPRHNTLFLTTTRYVAWCHMEANSCSRQMSTIWVSACFGYKTPRNLTMYNRNTLWLRDTVRQTSRGKSAAAGPTAGRPRPLTSRGKSAAAGPTAGRPRPLTSRGMSAWPYRVTTKYSFYPVRTFKMLNKK